MCTTRPRYFNCYIPSATMRNVDGNCDIRWRRIQGDPTQRRYDTKTLSVACRCISHRKDQPMMWSVGNVFSVGINKLLNKQASHRWLEIPWRSYEFTVMNINDPRHSIDPSHKSHNAAEKYPTIHHILCMKSCVWDSLDITIDTEIYSLLLVWVNEKWF